MVIDMCIDRTLGFLAQLGQKKYTLRVRGAVVSGQKTRVSGQEPEQSAKPAVDAPRAAIAFTPAGAIAPPGSHRGELLGFIQAELGCPHVQDIQVYAPT
jgi:hypothetical protein